MTINKIAIETTTKFAIIKTLLLWTLFIPINHDVNKNKYVNGRDTITIPVKITEVFVSPPNNLTAGDHLLVSLALEKCGPKKAITMQE